MNPTRKTSKHAHKAINATPVAALIKFVKCKCDIFHLIKSHRMCLTAMHVHTHAE